MCSKALLAALASLCLVSCGGGGGGGGSVATGTDAASVTLSRPAQYQLKFSDDFAVDGALGAAWTYDLGAPLLGGTVWGNNEQQYYTSDPANVRIQGGLLYLQPVAGVPAAGSGIPGLLATSARVKTDTPAYYQALNGTPYGFYEVRAQFPCVAGAWPAVWMMGKNGDWPARGEIDIAEWFGRYFSAAPNQMQSGIHVPNHYGANSLYAKKDVSGLCSGMHTYQLHWTASVLVMGVDGQEVLRYTKPAGAGAADWPFDQSAFLLLNVAVGGNLGGSVNLADLPSMTMTVDWVKVWQP